MDITQTFTNMAKAIRWQVPFVSISGTHYRVDIYDEGYTGSPVQLYAGEQPFVTSEDSSEDYFAPIRPQIGTLQVCTARPNGGRISLDELLPANNIARPVRLINLDNSNAIEWQGFLSCEAYSQNYTAIPENLSLSLIGVLEAMDSVQIGTLTGAIKGHRLLYSVLSKIATDCGLTMFTDVVYSQVAWRILGKYFDTDLFYETKDQINGSTVRYVLDGLSCKELLSRLCTFMGWTAREQGTCIYLQRIGEEQGMYKQTLSSLNTSSVTWYASRTSLSLSTADMDDCDWMGTDHKRDIRQGAKSVAVVAKIEDFDADMDLPDYPGSDPTTVYTKEVQENDGTPTTKYVDNVLEQDNDANNRCEFGYHYGKFFESGENQFTAEYLGTSTKANFLSHGFLRNADVFHYTAVESTEQITHYAGAAFIRYAIKDDQQEQPESYNQGLYCVFLQALVSTTYYSLTPIFKMHNPNPVSLYAGKLHIASDMLFFGVVANSSWLSYAAMTSKLKSGIMQKKTAFYLKLRVGQWWWNGAEWTTTETAFLTVVEDSGFDLDIPVTDTIFGQMELSIMPMCVSDMTVLHNNSVVFEAIFKSLEVSFEPTSGLTNLDRSENQYLQLLSTNFRDEIVVNTDIATDCYNKPSPSLIMDDPTVTNDSRYTTTLGYGTTYVVQRRPEVDLLSRLATYYSQVRQRLELKVKHITTAALALLKLNGINDGKKYTPLAESRDWQTDECSLTCFETPE